MHCGIAVWYLSVFVFAEAVKDYIQEAKARMCQDLEANLSLTSHHVDVQVSQRDIVRTAKPTNKVLDKELVIMGDTDRQKSLLRPSQVSLTLNALKNSYHHNIT